MSKQRYKYLAAILVLIVLASFVYWWLKSFAPNLSVTEREPSSGRGQVVTTEMITLFFADQEGRMVQEKRQVSRCDSQECRLRTVVDELRKGSFREYARLLPPETEVNNVSVSEDTASIDLLPVFAEKLPSGSYAEMMAVYSITNSICATMPEVHYVKLSIAGNPRTCLNHLDLSEPLAPNFEL